MSNEIGRLIHHYDVEGVLILGQHEHRPFQWCHVSLLTQGTLQIRIRFVRQRSAPDLEQTNKQRKLRDIFQIPKPSHNDFYNSIL